MSTTKTGGRPYLTDNERVTGPLVQDAPPAATTGGIVGGIIRASTEEVVWSKLDEASLDEGFRGHPLSTDIPEARLTVKQAAAVVSCCEETIRRAYLSRQLKVERIGRRSIRIPVSELREWLARGGPTQAA